MKGGFFRKTAWNNIKKNYRFFIPRILSEAGLLACFYISLTLALDDNIEKLKGGSYVFICMWIGVIVLSLLSVVLIFYINSFLMRQRKREFGLYNVLGMEKKHIGKVMFHETFIAGGVSVLFGTAFGLLLYKLCALLICKILQTEVIFGFDYISPISIVPSVAFFAVLDFLTYIVNLISVRKMKPVEMLASKSVGEKEPKVKIPLLIIGIIALAGGYVLALKVRNPVQILLLFFPAVILVVLGTYFLFTSGSVFVLKALKKNKKYYYDKRHMPAVSGLIYRMKQNAVGLASIALLATAVLVMISTTVSLYTGMQKTLDKNYPQDFYAYGWYVDKAGEMHRFPMEVLQDSAKKAALDAGLNIQKFEQHEFLEGAYIRYGKIFRTESEATEFNSEKEKNPTYAHEIFFMTEEEYTKHTGEKLNLTGYEIAVAVVANSYEKEDDPGDEMIFHGVTYKVVKHLRDYPVSAGSGSSIAANYGIVVSDDAVYKELCENLYNGDKYRKRVPQCRMAVTFDAKDDIFEKGGDFESFFMEYMHEYTASLPETNEKGWRSESLWDARFDTVGMYGSFLFLGIILGTISLFATVLIIYYKQISEGYEDRERFIIMEKIGMSKAEVKKTINSQVLLVFFLPLITAGIHLCFAYPMLKRMLRLLMLPNDAIFFTCAIITYAVFALVYVLIYSGTSKTYYKIVN